MTFEITTPAEKLSALLAEAQTLTPEKDSERLRNIYAQSANLVNRNEKPKQWAALRMKYAQVVDPIDPQGALAAYREALPFWDPEKDQGAWASCKACIGWCLAALGKVLPPESEEVIECLESTIQEFPYGASTLAAYYTARLVGDPFENWRKRVYYLQSALEQVSPAGDPVQWARLKNDLAVALPQEPDGDFAKAMETRIRYHEEALAVLEPSKAQAGSSGQDRWIRICLDTSEAYLSRLGTNPEEDRRIARQYAEEAYQACGPTIAPVTTSFATMGLARMLLNENGEGSKEHWMRALVLCGKAEALIDRAAQPVVAATNAKFQALGHHKLMELGEPGHLMEMIKAVDLAYSLLTPDYPELRRTVMQLAAETLLAERDFARATSYLERAVEAGEALLDMATSRAGRLERIFELHDSYAWLGYCLVQTNQLAKGIEIIDRGKGRLWRSPTSFASFEQMRALVPKDGALLFGIFAPKDGVVVVVTERGERLCQLGGFGREALHQMLLGDVQNPNSSSWISRYVFRGADPQRWRDTIDTIGGRLFELLWLPLLQTLQELGIKEGAELIWFPQAGLGVFPLHAAWTLKEGRRCWIGQTYAMRYAPSASALIANMQRNVAPLGRRSLVVADPTGNLSKGALETAWVRQSEPEGTVMVLSGSSALKQTVVAELAKVTRAHFCTHAVFRVDDPFQSNLLLANGESLSLEELLLLMEKRAIREVILSGCETAMAQVARRPDEFLGFPAAFLEHGAATVVATQWPVDDWAAAVLVGRFYREWHENTAAQAMRAAQNWMREVTVDELSELLRPLKKEAGAAGTSAAERRTWLAGQDPTTRPFSHPYYWAAFTVSGN